MSGFSPAFERLGAAHAAVGAQQQESLAEVLPTGDWSADLSAGTYSQGPVTLRVALLGSYAETERTWLWAWANQQFRDGDPMVADAREIGERLGVPELTTPELDLGWYDGPARNAGDLVAMATSGLLDATAVIPAPYENGLVYFVTGDVPDIGWDPIIAPRMILSGIALFPYDHRLSVLRYFAHHHLPYTESPTAVVATLPDGGTCTAEFDTVGRFTGLTQTS